MDRGGWGGQQAVQLRRRLVAEYGLRPDPQYGRPQLGPRGGGPLNVAYTPVCSRFHAWA